MNKEVMRAHIMDVLRSHIPLAEWPRGLNIDRLTTDIVERIRK
jgi:hypothetical protein